MFGILGYLKIFAAIAIIGGAAYGGAHLIRIFKATNYKITIYSTQKKAEKIIDKQQKKLEKKDEPIKDSDIDCALSISSEC